MKPSCHPPVLAILLLTTLSAAPLAAAEPVSADTPMVAEKVRRLMQDRNYPEAIKAIDEAARAKDAPKDYLAYLKGRTLHLQKQYDQAAAAFDRLQKQFPQSPWARRARFGKAVALARKGDFRGAELIYRAEAEYLLSADRKQQIADVYLEFADAYFRPAKPQQKPDYKKSLEFYQKALEVGPKPDKRIEVELLVARCHQELAEHDKAATLYEKFIERYPGHALQIEARYRLGECRLATGKLKKARRTWQDLLAGHHDSTSKRIAEAMFKLSRTWRIPSPGSDEEMALGTAALERFIVRFPQHELAGQAHLEIARSVIHRGRHEEAAAGLSRFLADGRYRDCAEVAEARNLLGRSYQLQKKFSQALAVWRQYLVKHPAHKQWNEVQAEVISTEYLVGLEKCKAKQYQEARKLLSEFLAKYPLDARNPGILLLFGQINHEQEKWDEAIADWRRLVSKHPGTRESSHAQYMIAATLEEKLGKPEEAMKQYRKLNWGPYAASAQQAVARLTGQSMAVATERVFRSDETCKLKLTTRNVKSVTVRVYEVDLETYFRKMHLARGVERLDIALIDPDKTFEFNVPDYADYQQLDSEVEVPLVDKADGEKGERGKGKKDEEGSRKAGVTAVTLSTERSETTTMLIRSDLDVIVKSSRDEVFVFAQNMRTGKPWPGVRLLISDGTKVFAEALTGDDGVLQQSYDELRNAGDVRVFAVAEGHVASNTITLAGVGVARGLSDKGYIYTDRPAYRAGQLVNVRGCLRWVVDDAYTIEDGKRYTLEVFDARNRMLRQDEVTLSAKGSFHAHFTLPVTSPQGQYRILVRDDQGHNYQGTFRVHEYKLEPVRVTVDTPRRVYCRGEEIEGTIKASFYYGAPLAGRQLRYRLADGRLHTARTDQQGQVRFKLPTREYDETQRLRLSVSLPERNLQAAFNFVLAARGFTIGLGSARPVYVSGETFEVTVKTQDAQGRPAGRKLTLKVLRQTTVEGKVGERLVEEHPLETGPTDGAARQTLKLAEGGRYVLRAEGTDRLGNPVSGQHVVQISDRQDRVRLRILADRHTFKVGDTARLTLHWREDPALALVTFQGARVLDYRLVELKTGPNPLAIPMTARLAPNFELAVAVMIDPRPKNNEKQADEKAEAEPFRRFHTASSPFTVQRDLRVKIAAKREGGGDTPVQPGDQLEVTLLTTDPQGKPVAAEVSLAMVEQSLLERFAWPAPPISDFFRGSLRQTAVRTTSSITFAYSAAARAIDPQLLAERRRLEIAREEAASLAAKLAEGRGGAGIGRTKTMQLIRKSRVPFPDEPPVVYPAAEGDPFAAAEADESKDPFGSDDESSGDDPFAEADGDADGDGAADPRRLAVLARCPALRPDQPSPEEAAIRETGYWNPAIVTGQDGKATVTFPVPQRSTAWKLLAKGITADTLAGEATDELLVKKDLFGQLKLPAAFTEGDEAQVTASVHNEAMEKGRIEVTLKTIIDGRTVEDKRVIDVTAKGIHELAFKTALSRPERPQDEKAAKAGVEPNVVFELTVAAGDKRDRVRRAVPLKPYGMPAFATASGSATADTTAWIEPPKQMPLQRPTLQIIVGPTVEQSLLEIVFGRAPWCQIETGRIASEMESASSDLLAALALQKLLGTTREAGTPTAQALDRRIRALLGLLVSAQNDHGGWSWTGRGGRSNRYESCRAFWAISLARSAGYAVPGSTRDKAVGYLRNQLTMVAAGDHESKAILLHALSTAGAADFAVANRLYRIRPALSPAALAYLALALAEMDRRSTARELVEMLAEQDLDGTGVRGRQPAAGDSSGPPSTVHAECLPWSHSPTELKALWALAIQRVAPRAPQAKQLVDWLLARRTGHRWAPDKATGPAAIALCEWFGQNRFQDEQYKLAVFVNDVQVKLLQIDQQSGSQVIDVPSALLKKQGKQRVNFQITGRGRYTYQCILGGFVPADKLAGTTDDWQVKRTCQPAPLEVDGREIPRGFAGLAGSYKMFRNPLTQLPVGRRAVVELELWRQNVPNNTPQEHLEYLVITEPIPAGAAVIDNSVKGPFERFEISPGAITFYVGNRRRIGTIRYELHGYLPGKYRAGPTVIRNAHRPEQLAVARSKPLAVLPRGQKSSDPYRLTPQELYELGRHHFQQGDLKTAEKHLTELIRKWNLGARSYHRVVSLLLEVHLELGPPAAVVRYFEIIKEKWPAEVIPFEKILKIGTAYHEMGEYERSYLVFRATVENSFLRESGVAGFLQSQGEFARSVDLMGRLLREYPPEGYVAAANYALAQRVYAKAPRAAEDERLRQQKINRVDLVRRASTMLESFLTAWPEDPAADQAAFSKANTLLELGAYEEAVGACNRYAERYPASNLLDTYWYIIGYCHFAGSRHEDALAMCRKVAEARPIDKKTGRRSESPNKWRAIYIMGQVYHSLGRAADAVGQYRLVKDRFTDAGKSIRYFLRKAIALPEVTTVRPGEAAEVELKFRNIAACDVKVYRIDLMKFSLMRRNLGGIKQINLAGIRPHHEAGVRLGDGKDYRDRTHKLALPLKKEGAYLVVCRGNNLHTSGLVLLTPLAIEVEADPAAGQVRTTVKDRLADRYLSGVHVKVIGSRNNKFVSGATDLRGVFTANGIEGTATVIARTEDSRYAFHRQEGPRREAYRSMDLARRAVKYRPTELGGEEPSRSEKEIKDALASPTQLEVKETPLQDVVDYFKDYHNIEIQIDKKSLDDVGIGTDTPISKNLKGVSLRSALRTVLRELDLTYLIQDEVLLITTPEEAEQRLETKVYSVQDLVLFRDEKGQEWPDFDALIELISSTVAPQSWDEVGGPGSVAPLPVNNTLVISQTQEIHEQIQDLLENIRRTGGKPTADGKPPIRKRVQGGFGGMGGGMGGFGGMGGGMGGMGGGQRPFVISTIPVVGPAATSAEGAPATGGMGELLEGLQEANKALQGQQVDQLQKMYNRGMGGFGGGMGGGVSAGAAF